MFEASSDPIVLFSTRTNTELGAQAVSIAEDGSLVLAGILKKVTESMLTSYPRAMLGKWTPNRASLRYPREEIAGRKIKSFETGEELDLADVSALAD